MALLAVAAVAGAHDFWLVPETFHVAPGDVATVLGQTSSRFPTSESAVAVDRLARAEWIGADGSERIADVSHRGTSLVLRHRARVAGQSLVAVALHPRSVRESTAGFRRYLELEGAPEALARLDREGALRGRDSVTRRYAKYAKTFVEVGANGPRMFDRVVRHPLEFVPLRDPASIRPGDTLAVRLLYRGQPLVKARVHAGVASRTHQEMTASTTSDQHLVTDSAGRVHIPMTDAGTWNVRAIHIVAADRGSGADWDTHWATVVFHITSDAAARPSMSTATVAADSLDVARVVEEYHRALETGDSLKALALLQPDALILESGGIESREEYRAHHLPADIQFAQAIRGERSPVRVRVRGDVAWASSTSIAQGTFRGRAINASGAELMVLVRSSAGWRISAIHWSSRNRR